MILTKGQEEAFKKAKDWWNSTKQLFKLQGLAGTGKTTIAFMLINHLGIPLEDVLFCTYVGKATLPLRKNGLAAKTIHSTCYTNEGNYITDEFGNPILTSAGRLQKKKGFVLKDKLPSNIKLIVVDEAGMVPKKMSDDLLSFGIKVLAMGDRFQLPPVFGKSEFLINPDAELFEIMRQKAGDPIIHIADMARKGIQIPYGKYGPRCFVVDEKILDHKEIYLKPDIILCGKNKTRQKINEIIRYDIKHIDSDLPVFGDKLLCRNNNWNEEIDGIPLINGLVGYATHIYEESFNGSSFNIDFMPECLPGQCFEEIPVDYAFYKKKMGDKTNMMFKQGNCFEFGHACTVHAAQGSQYGYVLGINEQMGSPEFQKRFLYTMITRSTGTLVLVQKRPKELIQFF